MKTLLTIQVQIDFIKTKTSPNGAEIWYHILESLEKLKAQEDLIDQQADELISNVNLPKDLKAFQRIGRQDRGISAEIAEIKLITSQIAEKLGCMPVIFHEVSKDEITESIEQNNEINRLIPVDPAIVLLLGDPSELKGHALLKLSTELEHDITILTETRYKSMTTKELYSRRGQMHYKTDDIDLLESAYALIQTYLPF